MNTVLAYRRCLINVCEIKAGFWLWTSPPKPSCNLGLTYHRRRTQQRCTVTPLSSILAGPYGYLCVNTSDTFPFILASVTESLTVPATAASPCLRECVLSYPQFPKRSRNVFFSIRHLPSWGRQAPGFGFLLPGWLLSPVPKSPVTSMPRTYPPNVSISAQSGWQYDLPRVPIPRPGSFRAHPRSG